MKIGVRLLGLREGRLEARIAELRARLSNLARPIGVGTNTATDWQEVSNGERELDAAAGDVRDAVE